MKPFIYTCEHCGSEYNITDPGKYECSTCNNTFFIEDIQEQEQLHFQEQQKKLEEIKGKSKIENDKKRMQENKEKYVLFSLEKKEIEKENQKKKPKYKGIFGEIILLILFYLSNVLIAVSIIAIACGAREETAILLVIAIISSISHLILLEFYRLIQAIEYNTRKEE